MSLCVCELDVVCMIGTVMLMG